MEEILIFPYSGTAIEALDCLQDNQVCIGFISDDITLVGTTIFGIKIYDREAFNIFQYAKVLAVNGSPTSFRQRKQIIDGLNLSVERFTTVIHPRATLGKNVVVGYNTLIMAGCVITSNAVIKNHICILPNTVVHHDSIIKDYTLIAANNTICGNVIVGNNSYIGAASSVKNGVTIDEFVMIGIGSNVIKSITKDSIVKGNPAK